MNKINYIAKKLKCQYRKHNKILTDTVSDLQWTYDTLLNVLNNKHMTI